MAKKTLKSFIEDYINNSSIKENRRGLSEWIRENGIQAGRIYSDSASNAYTSYIKALSGYGSISEQIGESGLTEGGYAKYIDNLAKTKKETYLQNAKDRLALNTEKNLKGYIDKLSADRDTALEIKKKVLNKITDSSMAKYEDAYRYAIESGLSEKDAEKTARDGTEEARKKLKQKILSSIVSKSLTEAQTREYAQGMGLPSEDVAELCKYAAKINETVNSDNYGQYFKP